MDNEIVVREDADVYSFINNQQGTRLLKSFTLDVTARCNNDCRHCYINQPANSSVAASEISAERIFAIADEAISVGALRCLISGGEPLLRGDFEDIYVGLKRKGLLVSVFTNACLVTDEHVRLFKQYPPKLIDVTVYGATQATYERVSRKPGTFNAFSRGLSRLLDAGIPVRLKAMAIRSNVEELHEIRQFCRARSTGGFRFDPWLHMRYDGDPERNAQILEERLSPEEFVAIEMDDAERHEALLDSCKDMTVPQDASADNKLFICNIAKGTCYVSYDGKISLCSSLQHPELVRDLRYMGLVDGYNSLVAQVKAMRSDNPEFLSRCTRCGLNLLCLWCPASAHLECGRLDAPVDYFCRVAHARAAAFGATSGISPQEDIG